MIKLKKRIVLVLSVICIVSACLPVFSVAEKSDDIVILYENDVHCAIDGYSKIIKDYIGVLDGFFDKAIKNKDFVDSNSLEPYYVQLSQAELNLKDKVDRKC